MIAASSTIPAERNCTFLGQDLTGNAQLQHQFYHAGLYSTQTSAETRLMVRLTRLIVLLALLPAIVFARPNPADLLRARPVYTHFEMVTGDQAEGFERHEGRLRQPDPYGEGELKTSFELYIAPTSKPAPLVLVLAPYRGKSFVDRGYAEALVRAGMHAAIVAVPKEAYQQDQGIDYINRFFLRHTLNTRTLAHALQYDPKSPIKISRIGLIGTSLGGIRGSILFGIDPRFEAAVLIVPGGDLPSLIANTVLAPISRWRERLLGRMETYDPSEEKNELSLQEISAFERHLRPHVLIEPLQFVRPDSNDRLLWVRSNNDNFVPRKNQDRLFNAYAAADHLPPAEIEGLPIGHYATVLAVYLNSKERITDFLGTRLCSPPGCRTH
jgi:dienelactone hydrolase